MRNQDVLSHLLRNLASLAGTVNGRNIASLLEGSQDMLKAGTSGAGQNVPNTNSNGPELSRPVGSSIKMDDCLIHQDPPESMVQCEMTPANGIAQKCIASGSDGVGSLKSPMVPQSSNVLLSRDSLPPQSITAETTVGRVGLSNIDLNDVYDDVQDYVENPRNSCPPVPSGIGSVDHPLLVQCDSLKSSPPQTSRNTDSTSSQSPSSSSGEAQVYYFSNLNSFFYYFIFW